MLDNGQNNGSLYLSLRDAADRLGFSDHRAVSIAFDELRERGFVSCEKEAHFHVKAADQSRARCWRLTWLAAPSLKRSATNDWESYDPPPGSKQRKRALKGEKALKRYYRALTSHRLPVLESTAFKPAGGILSALPVVESTTACRRNGAIPPIAIEVDSNAHTAVTTSMRPRGEWWRARAYLRVPDGRPVIFANDNTPEP